ncbi:MAG TPA: VOC family protein [Candidatus Saccharimonadales bacterium]|nr:VOC family protein [Candidatus Saccharimonadales bacterium]
MIQAVAAFSGFSVDDLSKAKDFYTNTLGLKLDDDKMGLQFKLPGGGQLFVYDKPDHQPATFTVLNFVVDDIDKAVDDLVAAGVKFEIYDNPVVEDAPKQDEKGIARGKSANMGPDIAWFKDPAGNVLSVLQN